MEKKKPNKLGFSLAEALIASAILIFVLVAFVALYVNFFKFYSRQQTEIRMGNSARLAVKELQSVALQANQINDNHDFSGTNYSTDQDTLVLKLPAVDASGDIVNGEYDYVVFYTTGKNLYKLVDADGASVRPSGLNQLSDTVSSLTFTYNNANLALANKIDMDIQMQEISGGQDVSYHLYQEIYLRNL